MGSQERWKISPGPNGALKGGKESASLSEGFNWSPQKNVKHFSGA